MALTSQRNAIADGLVALLQTVQNAGGSAPLYSLVKKGHVVNPGTNAAWCEVLFKQGQSGPAGSGGNIVGWRIEDNPIYLLTSGFLYDTDTGAAMTAMLQASDILLPLLHSHVQIPVASNPSLAIASVYSVLEEQPDTAAPIAFPNGKPYLLWNVFVKVKQQYNVQLTQP